MIELFIEDEDSGLVKPNPELKTIVCFKELIERDKGKWKIVGDFDGRRKYMAIMELAYIYWEGYYKSPFQEQFFDPKQRFLEIKKMIGVPDKWEPDDLVKECLDVYIGFQVTDTMEFLKAAKQGLQNIKTYIQETDINSTIKEGPHKGQLIHDVNKYKSTYKEMPELVEAYSKLKDKVESEIMKKKTGKAGRELGMFAQTKINKS